MEEGAMRRTDRRIGTVLCWFVLTVLPAAGSGEEKEKNAGLYDCGERTCGEWAPKGENTCRSCSIAQCKKQNGGELLVGEKKQSECYQGHGAPPKSSEDAEE
jgi:hypothetical protein